ncbi:MAG: isopentenyl-diphosphate Delta-isomerase [Flavobacteriales bacterium]
MSQEEQVILVDECDIELGCIGKMRAHRDGLLHRAFSVFLFNDSGEMLLQKRAMAKYHSPGLWTNTCCSHPRPGETTETAALRRLKEEMGITCHLNKAYSFVYQSDVGNGLIEHEFDHVYTGITNALPIPNSDEVMDFRYIEIDHLMAEISETPGAFTTWFKITLGSLLSHRKDLQLI